MRAGACAIALLGLLTARARAQEPPPSERTPAERRADEEPPSPVAALDTLQLQSAAPDAPTVQVGWRFGTRARVGVRIPAFRELVGWAFLVDGLIDLYDRDRLNAFPFEFWRGAFALAGAHRWASRVGELPIAFAVTFGLWHESDHPTVVEPTITLPRPYFFYTNGLLVRGDLALVGQDASVSFGLTLRAHVVSCTRQLTTCDTDLILDGAQSFEANLDVALRAGGPRMDDGNVRFCASLHAGAVVPTDRVVGEARATLDAGGCVRFAEAREFQLLVEGLVGSDIGLQRNETVAQIGGSARWVY